MPYIEEIQKAYKQTRAGDRSELSVQKALQFENWNHLPEKIRQNICCHPEFSLLTASNETPIPTESNLVRECQIRRKSENIKLAYSLYRCKENTDSPRFDMLDDDDFPQLFKHLLREESRDEFWVTTDPLLLSSEKDLHNFVQRLGLYHWMKIPLGTIIFSLKWQEICCVKPNALDARLAFYFHQTPGRFPGRTRNLKTSKPDMEEWLYKKCDMKQSEYVGGCRTSQVLNVNMSNYYIKNAERIQGRNPA